MIDFIEIHAVQLADGIWHFALLIKQGIAARYRHQRTGGIPQASSNICAFSIVAVRVCPAGA